MLRRLWLEGEKERKEEEEKQKREAEQIAAGEYLLIPIAIVVFYFISNRAKCCW